MSTILSMIYLICIFFLFSLIKFLHKVWWTPIRLQNFMASQGIKGPSYRFFHGNTKEITSMKEKSMSNPTDLSRHDYLFPRMEPQIYSWINNYGKNFLSWRGPQAQLFITELDLVKEVFNNKEGAFPKWKLQGYLKLLIGDGIFVSEGEKWSRIRKLANHAFHAESLKGMVPAMIASVQAMLETWRHHEGKEVEVYQDFRLLTAEVISRTAFGSSYLEGKNIFEMMTKLRVIYGRNELKIRFPGIE